MSFNNVFRHVKVGIVPLIYIIRKNYYSYKNKDKNIVSINKRLYKCS